MKKVILLLGCLGLLTVGILGVSCKKDKDDKKDGSKGCVCTERYEGESEKFEYTPEEMEEYDATNCSQLARNINEFDYDGEAQVTCSGI